LKLLRFAKTLWAECRAGRPERALRRISYKLIRALKIQRKFSALYRGARFHPFETSLSRAIWLRRESFHRKDLDLLLDFLRPGDCFVDVGANIGTHSICASVKFDQNLRVFAFEPHPIVYQYLMSNIALNRLSNIDAYNIALGAEEGEAKLQEDRTDDTSWINPQASAIGYTVPVKPLDSLCLDTMGRVTTIKIDVEGYELYVLQGAKQFLSKGHFLCLEMGDRHSERVGYAARELMSFLEREGWRLFRTPDTQTLEEITSNYQPPDVENLIASRDIDLLRERLPSYQHTLIR